VLDDEDVDTVGGLLSKALGRVPIPGASAVVHGLELVAERPAGRRHRIATVLVRQVAEGEDVGLDLGADAEDSAGSAAVRRSGSADGSA
jgi:Mg2+/Co2+ transporter CorC